MTSNTRSPKEIEREIEEQRSNLASNLSDLQNKFSIDTIARQVGDQFREHGGDMGRSISNQVKANPISLALTGIGLAWMMFGNASKKTAITQMPDDGYSNAEHNFQRTRLEQGRPYVSPTSYSDQRNDGPSWSYDDHQDGLSMKDRMADTAALGTAAVKDRAQSAASALSDAAGKVGSTVSNTGTSVKSSLANAAQSAQDGLAKTGSRIAEGTENLTEEGRQRVIAARRKAIALRRQTAQSAQKSADAAVDFYDNQPLVVGALALAFGAALGGALPRTKAEDDMMGAQSDKLFSEAEKIYEEEKSKALTVAETVKDEIKDIASETKADLDSGAPGDKSAVQAIGDKAKSVANRVVDTAQTSAKDQKLGKPKV